MAARNDATDEFIITRVFDAPRELVWKAWTEPKRLMQWWGPKGFKMMAADVDLKPGGTFHYGMQTPDDQEMWGKFTYREIKALERLVFIVSFSDKNRGMTRHPFNPDWPRETLSTITFADEGGKTKITVRWQPHNATDIERKTFDDNHPSMEQGWGGTMEQLTNYLAAVK